MGSDDLEVKVGVNSDSSKVIRDTEQYVNLLGKAVETATKLQRAIEASSKAQAQATQAALKQQNSTTPGLAPKAEKAQRAQIDSQIKAVEYTVDQVQARVVEAAANAAERLIRVTSDALRARLNKATIDSEDLIARFNKDVQAQVQRQKREFARNRDEFRFSGAGLSATQNQERLFQESTLQRFSNDATARELARLKTQSYLASNTNPALVALDAINRNSSKLSRQAEKLGLSTDEVSAVYTKGGDAALLALLQEKQKQLDIEKAATAARQRRLNEIKRSADEEARENRLAAKNLPDAIREQRLAQIARRRIQTQVDAEQGVGPRASTFGERFGRRAETAGDYIAIGSAFAASVGAAAELVKVDDALSRFAGITQTTNTEMAGFRKTLFEVGSTSRATVSELAEISIILGQTGLSAKEVGMVLKPVSQLALASGSSLKETADVLTGALGAFQVDSSRVTEVANVMASALNQTKLNMQQLALGIQYGGNIANEAGVQFNEFVALLGSLANAGIRNGSTLGTGVRQLIQDLVAPSDKLKSTLKDLGISLLDIDVKSNGVVGVLENLKAKGFGTADALRTLDLRAAAAFAALSRQTDQTKKLQEILLLSNASETSAAKAGESLAAVYNRLTNNVIALLDNALRPFIDGLKVVGNAISPVVAGITQLVDTFGAAGSFAAVGGAALALRALSVGLIGVTAAAPAAAAGMATVGVASSALLGPVGIVIATVGALVGVLGVLSQTSGGTLKAIDQLGARLNDLRGSQTSVEATTNSLDKSLESLSTRQNILNKDPVALRIAVIEAQKAFSQWGLMVDSNVGSVEKLAEALRKLRGELKGEIPGLIDRQVVISEDKLKLLEQQFRGANKVNPVVLGATGRQNLFSLENATKVINGGALSDFSNLFGRDRNVLLAPDAPQRFGGAFDQIRRSRNQLTLELEEASKSKNLPLIESLTFDIQALNKMFEYLDKAFNDSNTIRGERRRIEFDRNAGETARSALALAPFDQRLEALQAQQLSGLQGISADYNGGKLSSSKEIFNRSNALKETILEQTRILSEELNAEGEKLKAAGVSPDALKTVLGDRRDKLAALSKFGTEAVRGATEEVKSLLETERTLIDRKLTAQIKRAEKQGESAKTGEDLVALAKDIDNYFNQLAENRRAQLLAKLEKEGTTNAKEKDYLTSLERDRTEEQRQEALLGLRKRETTLLNKQIDLQIKGLTRRISDLDDQISNLRTDEKAKETTKQKAEELSRKISELVAARLDAQTQQIGLELTKTLNNDLSSRPSSGNGATNYGPSGSAPAGSIAGQIIAAAREAGRADLARYLVAAGIQESSLNPRAKNPIPGQTSGGLFGFTDGTFRDVGQNPANKFDVEANLQAQLELVRRQENLFRNNFARNPNDQERYALHHFGSGDGISLLKALLGGQGGNSAKDFLSNPSAVFSANPNLDPNATVEQLIKSVYAKFDAALRGADKFVEDKGSGSKSADRVVEAQQRRVAAEEKRSDVAEEATADAEDKLRAAKRRADRELTEAERDRARVETERNIRDSRRTEQALAAEARTLGVASRRLEDPASVSSAILSQLDANLRLRNQSQQTFKLDPNNQEADPSAVLKQFAEKAVSELLTGVDRLGAAGTAKIKEQIDRLKRDIELGENNPGKIAPAELEAMRQRLQLLQNEGLVSGEIQTARQQALLLEEGLVRLRREGVVDEEALEKLVAKQLETKKKIAELEPRLRINSQPNTPGNSFGNAYNQVFPQLNEQQQIQANFKSMVDSLNEAKNGLATAFQGLFSDLILNSKKGSEAFANFGRSILTTMFNIISKRLSEQLINSLFGGLGNAFGGGGGSGGGFFDLFASFFGNSPTFAHGGTVRAAHGYGVKNRDSVPVLASPGEVIMRNSAVEMIGQDNLLALNAMGNKRYSQSAAVPTSGNSSTPAPAVNVWVVSKDAVPPPGPNDIIAHVADDIQRGGTIKQLIKSVGAGLS